MMNTDTCRDDRTDLLKHNMTVQDLDAVCALNASPDMLALGALGEGAIVGVVAMSILGGLKIVPVEDMFSSDDLDHLETFETAATFEPSPVCKHQQDTANYALGQLQAVLGADQCFCFQN